MKIAYLILCHKDPQHIHRLSKRLSAYADVFIHVDAHSDITPFLNELSEQNNIHFLSDRIRVNWGSFDSIRATVLLLDAALSHGKYDRFVLLQGADYPLKTDSEIQTYFTEHSDTEFIRGCRLSDSNDPYFRRKQYGYWFYRKRNLLTRVYNNILVCAFNKMPRFKITHGYITENGSHFDLYWGCAQFSATGVFARYLSDFYHSHPLFNKYMEHAFPCDEIYVPTVFFNSPYAAQGIYSPEQPRKNPEYFRNLHYFEYPSQIRIWKYTDYNNLMQRPELFIRKVTTQESSSLLDLLDQNNQ